MLRVPWLLVTLLAGAGPRSAGGKAEHALLVLAPSEQAAKDRLTTLVEIYVYARILGYEGVPKIFPPGELPLKESTDQWAVVLSFCPKKDAVSRAAAIKDRAADVQVLPVSGVYPDMCLNRRAFQPMSKEEKKHVQNIAADPKSAKPRVFYAGYLQSETRFAEAGRVLEKAVEIDPENQEAQGLLKMNKLMGQF